MPKGIASIKGNTLPKVGEKNYYEVATFYPGTPPLENYDEIKWKLYVLENDRTWRELKGELKTGKRVPYEFPEKWYGRKLLIEAYINSPEKKSPPGLIVMPVPGERNIQRISFYDSNWKKTQETPKYGQTLNVRINTINMFGETLKVSLWERDTMLSSGHDAEENTNMWGTEKSYKVTDPKGVIEFPIMLDPAWAIKAGESLFEGSEHEYYLLVKGHGATTKYSVQQDVKNEVEESLPVAQQEVIPVSGIGTNPPAESGRSVAMVQNQPKKDEEGKCPRCETDLTYEEVIQIFPRAANNETLAKQLIKELNSIKLKYGIDSCLKKAHMVTQMGSETEFRTLREEIDDYSVNTLRTLFGYFKRNPQEAVTYHGKLRELAIRAYGLRKVDREVDIVSCSVSRTRNCNDLGNETMEEGYTYIGRGLIQLTGKYNYTQINSAFQKAFPSAGNLITNPELLEQPKYAVMSGLSYWINNNLNDEAKKGSEDNHVDKLTRIINRNLDESHYQRRRNFFKSAKFVFKINQCQNKEEEEEIESNVEVVFDQGTNQSMVSNKSINILKKIGEASKTPHVVITSTARTPLEQATIMHDQTVQKGVNAQKALYGLNGDAVIEVYVNQKKAGKNRSEIIKKMEEKINELGPSKVSRHCGNQSVLNVFDVSSRRMEKASAFLSEARKLEGSGKEISKIINETDRNCYHFEIPQ